MASGTFGGQSNHLGKGQLPPPPCPNVATCLIGNVIALSFSVISPPRSLKQHYQPAYYRNRMTFGDVIIGCVCAREYFYTDEHGVSLGFSATTELLLNRFVTSAERCVVDFYRFRRERIQYKNIRNKITHPLFAVVNVARCRCAIHTNVNA